MARILILSRSSESLKMMKHFLLVNNETDIHLVQDADNAKGMLHEHYFDIIILDYPFLQDRHEISFLVSLCETRNTFVIVITNKSEYPHIREKVEKFGIFTMIKPIHSDVLSQFLGFIHAEKYRYSQYERKNERLLDKIKEIKLVDRAKCLLIENEFISENEAHKKIEQSAMNKRMTRYEVAKAIVDTYENE